MSRARTFADLATASEAGSLGKRNMIINGAMNIAQRGTSSTGVPTSAKYYPTVDRFAMEVNGTDGRLTMTQESITDLPGFNNAIKLDCTTADTSIAAAEYGAFTYIVEAQDNKPLKQEPVKDGYHDHGCDQLRYFFINHFPIKNREIKVRNR